MEPNNTCTPLERKSSSKPWSLDPTCTTQKSNVIPKIGSQMLLFDCLLQRNYKLHFPVRAPPGYKMKTGLTKLLLLGLVLILQLQVSWNLLVTIDFGTRYVRLKIPSKAIRYFFLSHE